MKKLMLDYNLNHYNYQFHYMKGKIIPLNYYEILAQYISRFDYSLNLYTYGKCSSFPISAA